MWSIHDGTTSAQLLSCQLANHLHTALTKHPVTWTCRQATSLVEAYKVRDSSVFLAGGRWAGFLGAHKSIRPDGEVTDMGEPIPCCWTFSFRLLVRRFALYMVMITI